MDHPITPPDELLHKWRLGWLRIPDATRGVLDLRRYIATQAAQWGWDQRGAATEAELQQARNEEFEACCAEVSWFTADILRAARRPKPLSDADQALADLDALVDDLGNHGMGFKTTNLRRALEHLKELEATP